MKRLSLLALAVVLLAGMLGFAQQSEPSKDKPPAQSGVSGLPLNFERHTGDLDEMVKRGSIRALVLYSRSGFFYVDGKPEGISYEALQYFEQFVNQKLRTRQHVQVTFIPVRPDQLESYLNEGIGDLIAYPVAMTPERAQQVAFSVPLETDVKQILVTGKDFGPVSSLQDLSGKKVFVNPVTTYYGNLEKVNDSLVKQGKPPILIESADKNLLDEDLMEMVNAGILPATVTITQRAKLWASVFHNITPQPNIVIANQEDLAWAVRKNNPKFKELVDEFVKTHAAGTSFGNTLMRRYLESNQWITNPTNDEQIKKFNQLANFFKTYSSQYGFDYLMVVAQGYQESQLNQAARSPGRRGWGHAGQTVNRGGATHQHPRHRDRRKQYSRRSEAAEFDCRELFQRPEDRSDEPPAAHFRGVQRGPESHRRTSEASTGPGTRSQQVVWQRRVAGVAKGGTDDRPVRQQHLQVLHRVQAGGRARAIAAIVQG